MRSYPCQCDSGSERDCGLDEFSTRPLAGDPIIWNRPITLTVCTRPVGCNWKRINTRHVSPLYDAARVDDERCVALARSERGSDVGIVYANDLHAIGKIVPGGEPSSYFIAGGIPVGGADDEN